MFLTSKIQVFILLYIQAKGISSSKKCDDINLENYCRYKVQIYPLTWEDAHRVCLAMNRTLLQIVDKDTLESVIEYASKCVYPRISNLNSELWVGIRAKSEDGIVKHYWENCDVINETRDFPWHKNDDTQPGCVAVKKSNKKYHIKDCSNLYPYICEAKNETSCFDEVEWPSEDAFSSIMNYKMVPGSNLLNCEIECKGEEGCIGFQSEHRACKLLTYTSSVSNHEMNERNSAFTMGFIGFDQYNTIVTSEQSANKLCFHTITVSPVTDIALTDGPRSAELIRSESSSSTVTDIISSVYSLSSYTEDLTESYFTSTPHLESLSDSIQTSPIPNEMSSMELSSEQKTEIVHPSSLVDGETSELALTSSMTEEESSTQSTIGEQSSLTDSDTTSKISTDVTSKYSSINSTGCMCPCSMYKNTSYSPEELKSRLEEIKEKLTVDRKKTSSYQRSLFSAPDDRISARRIGYVGVVIMAVICVLVVLMDVPRCISSLRDFINNCR